MTIDLLQRRGVPAPVIAQKAVTQEKAPSPGLAFVKLDFLIGTKWGSNAGRKPQTGGGDPLGTGYNGDFSMDFANIVKGCNPIHGGVDYLNLNCFAVPTAPSQAFYTANCNQAAPYPTCLNLLGNAGRNSLYGPGLATVDFSVVKNFHITKVSEAFNVQFRAEFFNILNHTNFQAPNFLTDSNNNSVDQTNAGILGSTTTTARQIQLGLKLIW